MNWVKQHLGLDAVDLTIHAAVTAVGMVIVGSLFGGTLGDVLIMKVIGISLVVFAWRRHRALKRMAQTGLGLTSGEMAAERFQELEQRVAELESAQARMAELEERVDFAERLLSQSSEERQVLLRPGDHHG